MAPSAQIYARLFWLRDFDRVASISFGCQGANRRGRYLGRTARRGKVSKSWLVGVWWAGGEDDVRPAGELAKGYSSLNFSGVGQNFSAILNIFKYVVDKGKSQVASRDKVCENPL